MKFLFRSAYCVFRIRYAESLYELIDAAQAMSRKHMQVQA